MSLRPPIDWVVCAAGKGSRFFDNGIVTPKPLIKFGERTFLERSLECLELLAGDKLIIVTSFSHQLSTKLKYLEGIYSWIDIEFIELKEETSGQLSTFLKAKKYLRKEASVVIWNCDTFFKSSSLLNSIRDNTIDAIVPCGTLPGNRWSFYKTDNNNVVSAVKEKTKISNHASVGFYFFKNSTQLVKLAKEVVSKKPIDGLKEHYVSAVHSLMIKNNLNVKVCDVDLFLPFGTVEDLKKYWNINLEDLRRKNKRGTLVVDIDNTITIENKSNTYPQKKPNLKLIKKLKEYKKNGFEIILYTARNMKTQNNNEALVVGNIGKTTIDWLEKYKVPYDGIKFGKPFAENGFYIDDKAIRPDEFINQNINELLKLTD